MTTNNSMSDAILEQIKGNSFQEGARYVLEYLRDIYGEGIEETDIWADYMSKEESAN